MAGFSEVKETFFFSFYKLDVEEKVVFETSLRRKLRLETGISTVFSDVETATPAPRKLRIDAGKILDKLLCMDHIMDDVKPYIYLFILKLFGRLSPLYER